MSMIQITDRIKALRDMMKKHDLDGFYIPRADHFQNEYVPDSNNRLEYITNFSGSAGLAIVLKDTAAFFTDGRYTLQAAEEIPHNVYEVYSTSPGQHPTPTIQPADWLDDKLQEGAKLGIDPWVITPMQYDRLNSSVALERGHLVPVENNLVDKIWKHRPSISRQPARPHPLDFAGRSHTDKINDMVAELENNNCAALVLTFPEEIAWLLNIRGNDVAFNPLCMCYAILQVTGKVDLFIDPRKVTDDLKSHLGDQIIYHDFEDLEKVLLTYKDKKEKLWFDPDTSPYKIKHLLEENHIPFYERQSPIQMAKACKNKTEQEGMVNAHIRDGIALTRFLARLDARSYTANNTEMTAAADLLALRREQDFFKDLCFETISGAGPAGAIIHYRVTEDSDKPLTSGPLYLLDSGAHYQDGTTDVTRTVAVDTPSEEMRSNYTRVLKGHIQVAISEFSHGTTGKPLDEKARRALKDVGLDYAHGTGHGVGSYLCVHEGPCGIHSRSETPLLPGMVVSNEPGYYEPGAYGIRLENLITVIDTNRTDNKGKPVYRFQTLTLAPFDRNCIIPSLLTSDEKKWLNAYHQKVSETLLPYLEPQDPEAAKWLKKATKSI